MGVRLQGIKKTQMQVANDVAAQAGALTTPPLPESCRAASSARIASRALWSVVSLAESAAFVAYEASSVASALAPWSAVMLASRPDWQSALQRRPRWRDPAGHLLSWCTSSGVSNPSTVEGREASALASALPTAYSLPPLRHTIFRVCTPISHTAIFLPPLHHENWCEEDVLREDEVA